MAQRPYVIDEMISAKQSLVAAQQDLLYNEYRLFQTMGELLFTVGVEL